MNRLYSHKTRNDVVGFKLKVKQRLENLPDKKVIRVLDAFAGEHKIWNEIIKKKPEIEFQIVYLEKVKGLHPDNIEGVNLYYLQRNDLSQFDVIDLDHYSFAYEQLVEIFEQNYKGTVFFTFIQAGLGSLNKSMLNYLFGSPEISNKCRTMYATDGFEIALKFFWKKGIKEINYQKLKTVGCRKYYGHFTTK